MNTKYCFQECTALTTFSIPSIQSIGDNAFKDCSALTGTLTIPSGAYVGNGAFNGTGYTTLVINTGTKDNATSFWGYAFSNMGGVTKVEIVYGGSNKIPDNTFKGAAFKDGVDLTISSDIKGIGAYAFSSANFPTNLDLSKFTSIGSHAFEGNTTLANKDISFAEKTTIGEDAFLNCTALTGELTIPNGANVAYRAFNGCSGITSIVLHSGMTSGEHDRNGCLMSMSGVKSVSIKDDGNHTIPANVFGHALFATDVTLTMDNTITAIGDYAFNNANFPTTLDLSHFTSYGVSAFESNTAFKGNANGVIAVQKPTSATSDVTVRRKAFWNTGATEIDVNPNVDYSKCKPNDAYYKYGYGPYNGTNINTIKFTYGITSVPDYVFLNASDIPSTCKVIWPTDPTHIGNGAFCGVKFKAAIPSKMSGEGTIGEYAYAHNKMSGEITIPTGCKDIGSHALDDCDNITKITVSSTTTSIGDFAFSECAALASVGLPTLTSGDPQLTLGGGFIANDPKLTAFTITNAVKTIYCCSNGNRNDASFSALTTPFTVTLASDKVKASAENRTGGTFFTFEKDGTTDNPNTLTIQAANGVTSIPDELFSENSSGNLRQSFIDKIVLSGTDVKSIGTKSFNHIRTLLSVDMSDAQEIASIGESAFADCAQLTTVTFGDASKITTIGASAFSGCKALASLNKDSHGNNDLSTSSLAKIESQAFANCTSLANIYFPSTLMRISSDAFSGALAATDDKVFIKADVPYAVNTFCRGFGVKMNSKDGLDALTAGDQSFSMWVPVKVDKVKRQLVLRPFVGDYLPSDEPTSADVQNTSISYSDVPAGIIFAPKTWSDSQYTPYDEEGDPTTPATETPGRQLNLRVKFTDNTTTVDHSHSTGDLSKSLLRGYIDTLTMADVTKKYLIWTQDLALHPVDERTKFPAGKCYIYDDPNSADAGSGDIASAKVFQIFLSDEPIYDGNTITGIKDIQRQNVNVDDNYYTLDGKVVSFPTEGIYIHHGKKVIIRRI